ncbi:MAG: MGMT family protein [Candidatus Falkowbacteria bacterium]|nr:MGMT family protein [Candidatus Falkowbacteria bacterium]
MSLKTISDKAFSKSVWVLTKQIPRGKVTTYSLLAKALKKPRAFRAVGNALNKNPYAPIVPCHRVVRSNGQVGGFASGSTNKIKLLRSEGVMIAKQKVQELEKFLYHF